MPKIQSPQFKLICLTGGVVTGKSRIANWFKEQGWIVICTDEIVHSLYEPGQPLPHEIAHEFGKEILDSKGGVDRKELAKIVFRDPSALRRLNELVHPKVRLEWKRKVAENQGKGKEILVVIPLAYETQVVSEFHEIWVAACSESEQRHRLRDRGFDDFQIKDRLATQWPLQKKIDLANVVIWNNNSWSLTKEQLSLIKQIPLN